MSERRTVTYLYDGTFDGFLTAVFAAYADREADARFAPQNTQIEWGSDYREIVTDPDKADRVTRGIRSKLGAEVYQTVWKAFLCDTPDTATDLYRYLRLGFEEGSRLTRLLADARVAKVNKYAALVSREAAALLQFVRFAQTVTGVYYAEISPQYAVLPLIVPHFVHRLNTQAFVIYDTTHRCSALSDGKCWMLTTADTIAAPDWSESERAYRKLWKTFYDTVAIEERINPALRQQLMPKKYWKHMVEMTELPVTKTETATLSPNDTPPVLHDDTGTWNFSPAASYGSLPKAP